MDAPSTEELKSLQQAEAQPGDYVVRWQSSFGLILIEVRGGETFVNGAKVVPARPEQAGS